MEILTANSSLPGLCTVDHEFLLPLDHSRPAGPAIRVFAREVRTPGTESEVHERPWLVFLQGGPGFSSPRPAEPSGWIGRAVRDYRVLLLDQRGTGRSTPVSYQTLSAFAGDEARATYLTHFRADSIVRDCESIRAELIGRNTPWTVLGQSFGGFCLLHYLSVAPHGLAGAIFTGGLPPLEATCDEVYRHTYARVVARNHAFFARYPGDKEIVGRLAKHLSENDVRLPSGDPLTLRKLQLLGIHLGVSDGFETLHYLLEDTFHAGADGPVLSFRFLRAFENALQYDTNPIYSLLHEACYAQEFSTRWAAQRVRHEFPQFAPDSDPFFFTGEMIYPWMFDEIGALKPLLGAAELLANKPDWPALYDRNVLNNNSVPAAAAIYSDDMYVERKFSEETACNIRGLRVWLTNEHQHNALRASGDLVFGKLDDMLRGRT